VRGEGEPTIVKLKGGGGNDTCAFSIGRGEGGKGTQKGKGRG
jgi:hypothetical protein